MPNTENSHSKGNIVMVTEGASIPDPRESRLINAWSIALAPLPRCWAFACSGRIPTETSSPTFCPMAY